MTEISDRYKTVAGGFTARLEGVESDRWGEQTPCSEWEARDLVAHVIRTHRSVLARLDDTWDLARATGQDENLDPGAVARAHEFLLPIDEAIRRPGGFAPKIEPAEGADEQTRFLNFCGRRP